MTPSSTRRPAPRFTVGLFDQWGDQPQHPPARRREQRPGPAAPDWVGMADQDIGSAINALLDLSKFPALPDRSQQGFLNFLFLAGW